MAEYLRLAGNESWQLFPPTSYERPVLPEKWQIECPLSGSMSASTNKKTGFGTGRTNGDRAVLYRMQAEICRVLGHPRRLEILDLLAEGEKSSAELLLRLGGTKVNLSQHLALMKHAGLVESRQEGRQAFHHLAFGQIKAACRLIREVLALRLQHGTRLARTLNFPPAADAED